MTVCRRNLLGASFAVWALSPWAPRAGAQPAREAGYKPRVGQAGKDVVWMPTNQVLVDRMLQMAQLTAQDRLVDLGSGDGRLVITAAKRGATARGIEYNADLVALARRAAAAEGVGARATFEQADIFVSDFSDATVVTLFLLQALNLALRPKLLEMRPGTRVVSNSFDMDDWPPDETVNIKVGEGCSGFCRAHRWVVPARVGGQWRIGNRQLVLQQRFQMLSGHLQDGSTVLRLADARLDGARILFTAGGRRYTGEVAGDTMRGIVEGGAGWEALRSG